MRLTPDEARRRFAAAPLARLATLRPDGTPHVVPVVFALEDEVVYTVVDPKPKASPELARLANVAANPRVTLLVDHYEEDWSRLWWVRAEGLGRVVRAGPERDRALSLLRTKYPQHERMAARGASFGAALVIEVRRWVGWTAAANEIAAQ